MNTPVERPADSAGGLYYPTPVTPEEAFQAIGRLRKDARDEIDRLIRFLDDTDNHMELEPSGDEGEDSDAPEEDDHDEDSDPAEPSLGSMGFYEHSDQERWASGGTKDLEDEHDGAEPDDYGGDGAIEDDEPSLGWTVDGLAGSQSGDDRELQNHAAVRPQRRTRLGKGIHAAPNYCHGNRILGLSANQADRLRRRGGAA
jgi:hypothetical protein